MSFMEFLGAAGKVVEAFDTGYHLGHELNDHGLQAAIDSQHLGAGHAGEVYLDWINHHGDPAPAVEAVHQVLETAVMHHDSHATTTDHSVGVDHSAGHDHSSCSNHY